MTEFDDDTALDRGTDGRWHGTMTDRWWITAPSPRLARRPTQVCPPTMTALATVTSSSTCTS